MLGACSDDEPADGGNTPRPTPDGATATTIDDAATGPFIENLEFHDMTVPSGEEVTVTNRDDFGHTFSFDGDAIEALVLGGGESGSFTAPAPGAYPIFCEIHGSMTATLDVQ